MFKADFIDSKGSDKQSDLVLTMKDSTMVKFCNIEKCNNSFTFPFFFNALLLMKIDVLVVFHGLMWQGDN